MVRQGESQTLTTLKRKKPPISRRFRMCSVTVLLAPPQGLEPWTL